MFSKPWGSPNVTIYSNRHNVTANGVVGTPLYSA